MPFPAALPARRSATQAAEDAIRAAILEGELAPGARLPPERALCATLGVSRLTLRAALASLAAAGLLAVRQGSGYRVRDFRESGGPDLLPGLLDLVGDRAALRRIAADLLRVRRHLAGAVLEALVDRPPRAAALRRFAAELDGFAAAVDGGEPPAALAAADLALVRALVAATGSEVLAVAVNPIAAVLAGSPDLCAAIYASPADNLAGWRALGAWLTRPRASGVPLLLAALAARDRATVRRLRGRRPR
jgi:GntR family transcriptional repressor for pyruvate dehydrogenase complex